MIKIIYFVNLKKKKKKKKNINKYNFVRQYLYYLKFF